MTDKQIVLNLAKMMEEMANAPKEEYGKRQPGEIGSYEKYTKEGLQRSELPTEQAQVHKVVCCSRDKRT